MVSSNLVIAFSHGWNTDESRIDFIPCSICVTSVAFLLVCARILLAIVVAGTAPVYAEQVRNIPRPDNEQSRDLLVRVQVALEELAKGEHSLKMAASDNQPEALDESRVAFRSAVAQFAQLHAMVDEKLKQLYEQPKRKIADGLTVVELESLRRNLSLKWARALRHQSLCFLHHSADRINSLSRALDLLGDLVADTSNELVVWQARGDYLLCLRLLGQDEAAVSRLAVWKKMCPPEMRSRLIPKPQAVAKKISAAQGQQLAGAQLYADGQLAESVAAYDRAAGLAKKSGDLSEFYQSTQTAAAICNEMAKPQAAIGRYRGLAIDEKNHPNAAQSHLTAIGIVVRELRTADARQRIKLSQQYENLLTEHLNHWPEGPQADKVRAWLSRLNKVRSLQQD